MTCQILVSDSGSENIQSFGPYFEVIFKNVQLCRIFWFENNFLWISVFHSVSINFISIQMIFLMTTSSWKVMHLVSAFPENIKF